MASRHNRVILGLPKNVTLVQIPALKILGRTGRKKEYTLQILYHPIVATMDTKNAEWNNGMVFFETHAYSIFSWHGPCSNHKSVVPLFTVEQKYLIHPQLTGFTGSFFLLLFSKGQLISAYFCLFVHSNYLHIFSICTDNNWPLWLCAFFYLLSF